MSILSALFLTVTLADLLGVANGACTNHPLLRSICKNNQDSMDFHGTHCFLKRTYTASGIVYDRGAANETDCRQNLAYSSVNNPSCQMIHPLVGTVCYDCCQQISCFPESRYCNQGTSVDIRLVPDFMKKGVANGACTNHPLLRSICKNNQDSADFHGTHCYLKRTYTSNGIIYDRGSANETDCMQNQAYSSVNNPSCQMTHPPVGTVCYDCCQSFSCFPESRYCNRGSTVDVKFMPDFMKTSPIHTTAITAIPTSVSSSPPTTSTVKLTTTAATSASACLICTEYANNSCSVSDIKQCSKDRPHCLNEVVYSNGKRSHTVHRCASNVECYWDYWVVTQGSNCSQSDVCTYCCDSTGGIPCNIVPEIPTNLLKFGQLTQNKAQKCMVTDDQNGEQTHDCSDTEGRFCMNNVYYDIKTNVIVRSEKKCALQDQCIGKWLQSRKVDVCLTGNTTGFVSTKNMLLCHYCCESNGTTPCNLKDRPDQIEQFIQPPTAAPSIITRKLPSTTNVPMTTTNPSTVDTTTTLCEDKPGIDCTILNTTNICANEFADRYCRKFCGHCTSLSSVVG